MNGELRKLLLLAAAAEISTSDMRSMLLNIQQSDVEDVVRLFVRIRRGIRNTDGDEAIGRYDNRSGEDGTALQAILDLTRASRIPPVAAAQMLTEVLQRRLGSNDEIPKYDIKMGFSRWLRKIITLIGPSAALNLSVEAFDAPDLAQSSWRLSKP